MRTFELIDKKSGQVTFAGVEANRSCLCPVCQHRGGGWCLVDHDRHLVICPRTISTRQVGEAGYLHALNGTLTEALDRIHHESKPRSQPRINFDSVMVKLSPAKQTAFEVLAESLGVTMESLIQLKIAWSEQHKAWAFPMRDAQRKIVGVRLRADDGRKWAITGSRNGLFYPELSGDGPVLLPEGPTDTAAALSLGFDAIGRPFCRGGVESLREVFDEIQRPAIVVADQDAAGIAGAHALAESLFNIVPVRVVSPPPRFKDLRAWLQGGATHMSVNFRIEAIGPWSPA